MRFVFADGSARAHARRWTNRQSAYSAVRETTTSVLAVAEAMHASAHADVERLLGTLTDELDVVSSADATSETLSSASPRFRF
jgi:DNA/RNA-binding domain of Phe-tRNA-synthetase-like protein